MKTQESTKRNHDARYSVHYKFNGNFTPIDQWLSQNCTGEYEYSIEDKPKKSGQTIDVVLQFEKEEDRVKFKDMILANRAP